MDQVWELELFDNVGVGVGQQVDRDRVLGLECMRFREPGLSYVRFAVQFPNLFGVMFRSGSGLRREHPNLAAAADRLLERIRTAVDACQREGVLIPGTPDEHALFCWSGVHGLASLIVEQQLGRLVVPEDLESRAQIVVDRIFIGLGARPT